MHSEYLFAQPSRGDLDRGRGAQVEPTACGDAGEPVAQQVDARLQVGHPHPQRLMLVQRVAELAAFHHAGQRDSDDPLARGRDLTGDRHPLVGQPPRDGGQPGARRATKASAGTQVSMCTAAVSSGPAPTLRYGVCTST